MTFLRSQALAVALIVAISGPAVAAAPSKGTWSARDLDLLADAAVQTEFDPGRNASAPNSQAADLLRLADALTQAGDAAAAKRVIARAIPTIGPGSDVTAAQVRADVVERLAQAGDLPAAEAFANSDLPSQQKATVLAKLGAARARAGDVVGARKVVEAIRSLPGDSGRVTVNPVTENNVFDRAVGTIGDALADAHAASAAAQLSSSLPGGTFIAHLLAHAATVLCSEQPRSPADFKRGREIEEDAKRETRSALLGVKTPYAKVNLLSDAVEAIAECEGVVAARAFVTYSFAQPYGNDALGKAVDHLIARQRMELGRAMLPFANPADPASLNETAKRWEKLGDHVAAINNAIAASHNALAAMGDRVNDKAGWYDRLALLGQISATLNNLGAYDEAIATIQPNDPINRAQYYLWPLDGAVAKGDRAAVAKWTPIAIEVFTSVTPPTAREANFLFQLTRKLALAGYPSEAQKALDQWRIVMASQPKRMTDGQALTLQADMGDFAGAFAKTNELGPLTERPSPVTAALVATMGYASAKTPPTREELEAATQRALARMPNQVPSDRAGTLLAIARDMATKGDVPNALKAEAVLETETSDILVGQRDSALAAISEARLKSGDRHGAVETAIRIKQPFSRWTALMNLVTGQASRL